MNAKLEVRTLNRSAATRSSAALNRTIVEHSSECHAVLVERPDGCFVYEELNGATLRLYGKTREQVVGHTLQSVFEPAEVREIAAHLRKCLQTGAAHAYERQQGEQVVEAVARPIVAEYGRLRRVVVSARDVTLRRRVEQQLRQSQKMEAVGQLTGGLAHDFSNMVAGISFSLELLRTCVRQGRIGQLERIIESAVLETRRAAALTHRLLAFARHQSLDARIVNINGLVSGMVELLRGTLGPGIKVRFREQGALWNVWVDRNQLESAILNVCINARDAMPAGGTLTIELANVWLDEAACLDEQVAPGPYVVLAVKDTGTGMAPDVLAHAFDPFFTTKPPGAGTGLGLSMVYCCARQFSGMVRVQSAAGQGCQLNIYLPRHDSDLATGVVVPVLAS